MNNPRVSSGTYALATMVAAVTALCLPYALVTIPPLTDLPGHMGAAAIEAALAPGQPPTPLADYFAWQWTLTFNLGSEVLMKVLIPWCGVIGAGWWCAVLATALFAGGGVAAIRTLNPRGSHGTAWGLMLVFSYPLLMGFINFVFATGLALGGFALARRLEPCPRWRAVMLLALQPVALICHGVGGALLAILVVSEALGREADRCADRPPPHDAKGNRAELVRRCWPLLATPVLLALWRTTAAPGMTGAIASKPPFIWHLGDKFWFPLIILRDQSLVLDALSIAGVWALLLGGHRLGARFTRAGCWPGLTLVVLFFVLPGEMHGSALVDVRLLPVGLLLLLGAQDWRGARPVVRYAVAAGGLGLLVLRLALLTSGFHAYAASYRSELAALDHVARGSRVLVEAEHGCLIDSWRERRIDHIASLASLYRAAWTNDNWSVPGLHMLTVRYRPAPDYAADPSQAAASRPCIEDVAPGLETRLARAPLGQVDYLWLIETGAPARPDPRLRLIWQHDRSRLYRIARP